MSKQNDLLASAKRHSIAATKASNDKTREAEQKIADRRWADAQKAGKR